MIDSTTRLPAVVADDPLALRGIEAAAVRIGAYRWLEVRTFEVLGGWVATVPELEAKVLLETHAQHHAWHAELWRERQPELRALPPDEVTAPASPEVAAFFDALAEPGDPARTVEKLAGAYRVLAPRAVAAYGAHLAAASEVCDGPTIRALRLVLRDQLDDWREGEVLLQSLLTTPDEVRRAADHLGRLEALLVAAGGIVGPPPVAGLPPTPT